MSELMLVMNVWLLDEHNMTLWEDKTGIVPGNRQVVMFELVAQSSLEVFRSDSKSIRCFKRVRMLLTLDGCNDDRIRPQ
jgi:hypothetical protein